VVLTGGNVDREVAAGVLAESGK